MLRYAAFHMRAGSMKDVGLLTPASLDYMRSDIVKKAGTEQTMGLTWHMSRSGGLTIAEHGGGTNGQISQLRLVPEKQWALAVVTNSGRGGTLNPHVLRTAMDGYFGIKHTQPTRVTVDAAALQEYAGTYRRQFADVNVTVDGDALKLQTVPKMPGLDGKVPPGGPARRFGFWGKDRLLQLEGPNAGEGGGEFVRGPDGRVAWLRSGRIHRKVVATTTTQ
jgi:hypothetical protein